MVPESMILKSHGSRIAVCSVRICTSQRSMQTNIEICIKNRGRPSFREYNFDDDDEREVEVIDTWNMTIEKVGTFKKHIRVELPGRPYMAVRIKRIERGSVLIYIRSETTGEVSLDKEVDAATGEDRGTDPCLPVRFQNFEK